MDDLRSFGVSFCKFGLAVVGGLGLSVALGVPTPVAVHLGAGALMSFPAAFVLSKSSA